MPFERRSRVTGISSGLSGLGLVTRCCAVLALLAGTALAQPLAPPTAEQIVLRCLGHLQRGEIDSAKALFDENATLGENDQVLTDAHQALRIGNSLSARFVDRAPQVQTEAGAMDTLVYHIKGRTTGLLIIAQTVTRPDGVMMAGLGWETAPLNLAHRYPFVWNVSYIHYYVLIAGIVSPLLMLYAIVACIRARRPIELLWIPLILVGVGKISATWLPGPPHDSWFSASPIVLQLFGVGFSKTPIWEPWVITVSFPLFAIGYLGWRRFRSNRHSPATPEPPPAESPAQ